MVAELTMLEEAIMGQTTARTKDHSGKNLQSSTMQRSHPSFERPNGHPVSQN
jgi:hypothetical protein